MRSAVSSLAWEFWSANRRGWALVLSAIPLCALLYRLLPQPINQSDAVEFFVFLPFVASIILATGFCNFTDPTHKSHVAGFPRHLFTRPLSTRMLVTCVMGFSVLSVVGIYVAWATLVFAPLGVKLLVRWPVFVIATGIVLYQAIVWCLSGFRITRVVVLSLAVTSLTGVAVIRFVTEPGIALLSPEWIEAKLTGILGGIATTCYAATVFTVGLQRRGSAWGWAGAWRSIESAVDAIPRPAPTLHSADAALTWLEWRRNGLLLPAVVAFMAILILGPAMSISGRGPEATVRALQFLVLLPLVFAYPIGKGFVRPNLWSMELGLSPFFSTRPIANSQIVAAKLKAAAWSTIAAWAGLLLIVPAWIYLTGDLRDLRAIGNMLATIYSPSAQWAIAILGTIAAMLLTWSFLIGGIWLGQSGRPGLFYSIIGVSLFVYLAVVTATAVCLVDSPDLSGDRLVERLLPWAPWALAALVTLKIWARLPRYGKPNERAS